MGARKSKEISKPKKIFEGKTQKYSIVSIVLRGLVLLIPLLYLSYLQFEFQPFQELLFFQTVAILNLIGLQFQALGYMIITPTFSSFVSFDCTAWRQLYIYFALVLLPPGISWAKRLWGLSLLFPLYIYNTLRVAFSIWVGTIDYGLFKPVHYFLWEFFFLVLIYIFWRIWFEWARKDKRKLRLQQRQKCSPTISIGNRENCT
jgi:exosortase/archaeosortase family protein